MPPTSPRRADRHGSVATTPDVTPFDDAVRAVRNGTNAHEAAQNLYALLDDDERLWLLDGDTEFWRGMAGFRTEGYNVRPIVMGAIERVGLPGIRFVDGPRGCVAGRSTAFPVSMARGATWDVALEERVGEVIGREIRAHRGNFFGGVCINLPRHPAWGRAQETYGDDPYHLGEFGAALTRGTQRWVMACAKHYALNSMENARFTVDVAVDEATLHDVYLPHFRRVVGEGVTAIMGAYNSVNGDWCGQNPYLLTTVLRDLWNWDGATVTDFIWGLRDGARALNAGMDLEEPFRQQRAQHLRSQLDSGQTTWDMVARAGVRLIQAQLCSYAGREEADPPVSLVADEEARALARAVARRAMVLLKNEPVGDGPLLPLDRASVRTIALIGRLATAPNMGDHGSSDVRPPSFVTPLEGLRAVFGGAVVRPVDEDDVAAAVEAATGADVAIVVAGFDAKDEGEFIGLDDETLTSLQPLFPPVPDDVVSLLGEAYRDGAQEENGGGDRVSLSLRPVDEDLIRAVAAANPSTVVVLVAAGAVLTEGWRHDVPAVLMMWYAGMEGGHALFSIPTSEDHLPFFDRNAKSITYDRYHGQRLLDRLGVTPAFPYGFGLSYTSFELLAAAVSTVEPGGESAIVTVDVANTGERDGRHVVQVYGRTSSGPYAGELMLVGFAPVFVPSGSAVSAEVPVSLRALAAWDATTRRRVPPGVTDVELEVGAHAHDPAALCLRFSGAG
jgi:beta-glucosidase